MPGFGHLQGGGQKPRRQVRSQRTLLILSVPVPPTQSVIVKVGHALGSVVVVEEEEEVAVVVVLPLLADAEVVAKMASQSQFPD